VGIRTGIPASLRKVVPQLWHSENDSSATLQFGHTKRLNSRLCSINRADSPTNLHSPPGELSERISKAGVVLSVTDRVG